MSTDTAAPASDRSRLAQLFVLSFLSLFLEMLVIRWLSTEVRLFSHVKNLSLIACFAGLGLGYSLRRWSVPLILSPVCCAVILLASLPPHVVGDLTLKSLTQIIVFDDIYSWHPLRSFGELTIGLLVLMSVFLLVVAMFVPMGQRLGTLFRQGTRPLQDYTVNVGASLLGILAFTFVSVISLPPPAWLLIGFLPLIPLMGSRQAKLVASCALLTMLLATTHLSPPSYGVFDVIWSPYQKIQMWRVELFPGRSGGWVLEPAPRPLGGVPAYMLDVNDIAMMWLLDMSKETLQKNSWLTRPGKVEWYDFPYRIYPSPKRALVIGSGGGNDVAAALRHGAGHVDAVEIDPRILEQGRKHHPERPYLDPRVSAHNTDARRFLRTTDQRYDLIVFGQLDNTDYNLMSNFANIRMDSYIYTRESFQDAFRLLAPGGIMVINFGASDWWGERVTNILTEAVGQRPRGFRNELQLLFPGRENTYVVGDQKRIDDSAARDPVLAAWIKEKEAHWTGATEPISITDDWPYWYLPRKAIPSLQLMIVGFIAVCSVGLYAAFRPPGGLQGHYFFLGAAFMLLESHLISKMALLFGSTWMVNAAVIGAVLLMILGANLLVLKRPSMPRGWCYVALFVALAVQWAVPPTRFLDLQVSGAVALALLLYSSPVFFAALIFAKSFEGSAAPDAALGSNLLGAILGGLLENASYVYGMSALVLFTMALYAVSAALLRRSAGRT